jgi:DNA-directed RNA polymerase specialized sigma24 family protein
MSEDFQSYRPLLFSIAYRMIGSASEAEDIVQDSYLRYRVAEPGEIRSLKSYLFEIVNDRVNCSSSRRIARAYGSTNNTLEIHRRRLRAYGRSRYFR